MNTESDNYFKGSALRKGIFGVFLVLSVAALYEVWRTPSESLQMSIPYFSDITPEIYKYLFVAALSIGDIAIIAPFAFLAYFGQHIKPREGHFMNPMSFFDIGVVFAIIFTITLGWVHYLITKPEIISNTGFENVFCLLAFLAVSTLFTVFLLMLKYRSYSSNQRHELRKYNILTAEEPPKPAKREIVD